jgi:hypothetical protein
MPLISGCTYNNPSAALLPAAPVAAAAPALAPGQGDHLFGDVLGTIETSLQLIFGGGANWRLRMDNYSSTFRNMWDDMSRMDLGHGATAPDVHRNGAAEPDEHSHVFGGYSSRLQWQMCEIVCTGFPPQGGEWRQIGGFTKSWKNAVLSSLDDILSHLVDSTAIAFYIATPTAIRNANAATVRHTPMSLANAVIYANAHNGPGKNRVSQVLTPYGNLRVALGALLDRFQGSIKTLNYPHDTWT